MVEDRVVVVVLLWAADSSFRSTLVVAEVVDLEFSLAEVLVAVIAVAIGIGQLLLCLYL